MPAGLRFDGAGPFRVLAYLNGWHVGTYTGDLGPRREFVLPAGLLRQHGGNTLALAVVTLDETPAGLGGVRLVEQGNHLGGVPVRDVPAPGYGGARR